MQLSGTTIQPNGDVIVPADTAKLLVVALQQLQTLLEQEQGLEIAQVGSAESAQQTANRQDFVDQLSAAVGIKALAVREAPLAASTRSIDHTDAIALVQTVLKSLSGRQ